VTVHKQPEKQDQRPAGRPSFGVLFGAVYVLALLPPVYIALTRQHGLLAAVPVSIWYLVLISAAAIAVTYALWVVERRNGAVD
jgi:hypothetical protein